MAYVKSHFGIVKPFCVSFPLVDALRDVDVTIDNWEENLLEFPGVVGVDIPGSVSAGFLEAGAGGGNDRASAFKTFDYRYSEPLVVGWVKNHFGPLVDGREVDERDVGPEMDPVGNTEGRSQVSHFVEVVLTASDGDEMQIFGESGECPDREFEVFASFYCADLQEVALWQVVFPSCFLEVDAAQGRFESLVASLIDDVDFVGVDAIDVDNVIFGPLADGDNAGGVPAAFAVF